MESNRIKDSMEKAEKRLKSARSFAMASNINRRLDDQMLTGSSLAYEDR
jgi:hypothetical protein